MTSIRAIRSDGTLESGSIENPDANQMVSYTDYYRGITPNKGTKIRDSFGSAEGVACIVPGDSKMVGYTYYAEIRGLWKDVQKVIAHYDIELGVRFLKPRFFELPTDLKTRSARFYYLVSYFTKIYHWVMNNVQ